MYITNGRVTPNIMIFGLFPDNLNISEQTYWSGLFFLQRMKVLDSWNIEFIIQKLCTNSLYIEYNQWHIKQLTFLNIVLYRQHD